MKKNFLIVAVFILISMLLSCHFYDASSNYIINNNTYISGFYEGLFANSDSRIFPGDLVGNSDDVWSESKIDIEATSGYKISFSPFDMYTILINAWEYEIFVNENQFTAAKLYYEVDDHFYYYLAYDSSLTYDYEYCVEISLDTDIPYYLEILNDYTGDVELLDGLSSDSRAYYFYKISKDGLFTTVRDTYYIIDNHLFLFTQCDDSLYYGIEIEKSISDYFIELINNNL